MALNQLSKPQKRKSRYRPSPTGNIRLQDRDIEIIKQVYKHRFLNSEHLKVLIPGSNQGILRRLTLLFRNRYLVRPLKQIKSYKKGSECMIYALGNEGAKLLNEEFGIPRAKVDLTSTNNDITPIFLEHTLMIAHFMVCLELACKNQKEVELIEKEEILETAPIGQISPVKWDVPIKREPGGRAGSYKVKLAPDGIFGLYYLNEQPPKNKALFFLEADRSTMPLKRTNFKGTSYYKKLHNYHISWEEGLSLKNFGFENPRVLTITKSQARIKKDDRKNADSYDMIKACKELDSRHKGLRMFLFAPASNFTLDHPEKILQKVWQNPRGETVSMVD